MRIIAHMVVGPNEAHRYLRQVLQRASMWIDDLHVALDPHAAMDEVDCAEEFGAHVTGLTQCWEDHEGQTRQEAWEWMEREMQPEENDFIALLDADEAVVEHQRIRRVADENPGKVIGFTFHEMWSHNEFRIDRLWKPYPGYILVPYRKGGSIRDRPIACGREPMYVRNIQRVSQTIANLLHYGYAHEYDRLLKHDRYMKLDGGRYHNADHIKSILYPPTLKEWTGGGLLDVPAERGLERPH